MVPVTFSYTLNDNSAMCSVEQLPIIIMSISISIFYFLSVLEIAILMSASYEGNTHASNT